MRWEPHASGPKIPSWECNNITNRYSRLEAPPQPIVTAAARTLCHGRRQVRSPQDTVQILRIQHGVIRLEGVAQADVVLQLLSVKNTGIFRVHHSSAADKPTGSNIRHYQATKKYHTMN